jgi:hypothetical protein
VASVVYDVCLSLFPFVIPLSANGRHLFLKPEVVFKYDEYPGAENSEGKQSQWMHPEGLGQVPVQQQDQRSS